MVYNTINVNMLEIIDHIGLRQQIVYGASVIGTNHCIQFISNIQRINRQT